MTDPFTLITMVCWLSGPPNIDQGYCDVMNADHLKTKNYLECTFRAKEFIRENEDPLFKYHGGTHKIAFCIDDLVTESMLDDDHEFTYDQYAKIWATGSISTTYYLY